MKQDVMTFFIGGDGLVQIDFIGLFLQQLLQKQISRLTESLGLEKNSGNHLFQITFSTQPVSAGPDFSGLCSVRFCLLN